MATLDGNAVFGAAVRVVHTPRPAALQINEYFGLSGRQALYGGGRGRSFQVSGVLQATNLQTLAALESELLSFADGQPHVLVDNLGRIWTNVVFPGEYDPSPMGPRPAAGGGWCLPYTLKLEGLV